MPKGRATRLRLLDMLDAIQGIDSALKDKTYEDFQQSTLLQRATERWLEIVSEAARYVPADMRARAPHVPWVAIEAFGNKTRHEYQSINPKRIWRTAVEDLAPLKAAVATFYAEVKKPADPWPDAEPE